MRSVKSATLQDAICKNSGNNNLSANKNAGILTTHLQENAKKATQCVMELPSPVGFIRIFANDIGVTEIRFFDEKLSSAQLKKFFQQASEKSQQICQQAEMQMKLFLQKELTQFDLPLAPHGTDFQKRVWQALLQVNYGTTASYLDIANVLNKPTASRAVGAANGKNPISIVIPCHRVIGSSGKLTGYAGGLPRKAFLLSLESSR